MQDASIGSEFNAATSIIKQMLGRIGTSTLVKVMAVTNAGGVSPVGFVDILPLVNQIDGAGNAMPHGTIFHVPYSRTQGGAWAIILDPQVGDIGIAVFASRDISSVKAKKGQANPGSRRRHDMADGLYVGGVLNGTPTDYVQFSGAGITITSPVGVTINSPVGITLNSPQITLNGNVTQGNLSYGGNTTWNGNLTINGVLTNNGHLVGSTHLHINSGGTGNSGPPV